MYTKGYGYNAQVHHIHFQALYYALPMNYISVSKLQNKLEGDANQATVRKLIDKMTKDGFVEAQSNRRLGMSHQRTKQLVHKLVPFGAIYMFQLLLQESV